MEEELAVELFAIGAVQLGSFTLKSGLLSPIYVDLRRIISFPKLLRKIVAKILDKTSSFSFDCVCGVPYTALPLATVFSMEADIPMVMRRKEVKSYGTKKSIEGVFEKGDRCLLIEDIITSGASVFETIEPLEKEGLLISAVSVILDREQGGKERIEAKGYKVHSLLKISDLLEILHKKGKITSDDFRKVKEFIYANIFSTRDILS